MVLLANDYLPAGVDEVMQLEAAWRLAHGLRYTVTWLNPADLSAPRSYYLLSWPAGYSTLVSAAMWLGAPIAAAGVIVKIAAAAAAIAGWSALAARCLARPAMRAAFCTFAGFFLTVFAFASSDLIVLAVFPFMSLLCLRYGVDAASRFPAEQAREWVLPAAGLLAGIAVSMKYSAIPLVVLGAAWVALLNLRHVRRGLRDLLLFSAPAVLVIGTIFLTNRSMGGGFSYVARIHRSPTWQTAWLLDPLIGLFYDATYLPRIAIRLLGQRATSGHIDVLIAVVVLAQLFVVAVAIRTLLVRGGTNTQLGIWFVLAAVATIGFLLLATSLYFPPRADSEWSHLKEGRYYLPLVPLMVLCVFAALESYFRARENDRWRTEAMFAGGVAVLCLIVATGYAAYWNRVIRAGNFESRAAYDALQPIRAQAHDPATVVLTDTYHFRSLLWSGALKSYSGVESLENNPSFKRETLVALVCSTHDMRQSARGMDRCVSEGFTAAAARYGFAAESVGRSSTLYWRVFTPTP